MVRGNLLAYYLAYIGLLTVHGLLQVCNAERQIIINESDIYGCTGTCGSIGEVFDKNGCTRISGCRRNSRGWIIGLVRCDYCICNCDEDPEGRDVTIENRQISVEEDDLAGTCEGTCERNGLVRTDFMGCQEVMNCSLASTGKIVLGFVRCDHCTCRCINRRYAVSYELTNIQYDLNGIVVYDGKPMALSTTILENKDPNTAQEATTTIAITHSVTETMETSQSLEIGLSVTVSVTGTITGVLAQMSLLLGLEVGGSITTSLTSGWTYTSGSSTTDERTYSTTPTIIVPPSSTTTAIISGSVMKIDIPYTADLVKTFEDGTKSSATPISGVYSDVETGRFTITYEEPIATGTCPEGWETFNSTCYIFDHSAEITFAEANDDCSSRGSSLATVHSAEEQLFLAGLMLNDASYVIGLSDTGENTFFWADGSNVDYTNWGSNQPGNSSDNEGCVGIRHPDRKWYQYPCETLFTGYICQQKAEGTDLDRFRSFSSSLSTEALLAIVLIIIIVFIVAVIICCYCWCRRKKKAPDEQPKYVNVAMGAKF